MRKPFVLPALALLLAIPAGALTYTGDAYQFAGGFNPGNAPYGGFGGGSCTATKTPIVFLHGNGDEAKNWDYPSSTGVASVYDTFKAAGYNDCELFGLTWLSSSERGAPSLNYHKPAKAAMVRDFVNAVKTYTGKFQVDVIGHSTGVSTTWAAATRTASGTSGRRTTPGSSRRT